MSGAKKYDFSAFDEASNQEPKKEYDFSAFDDVIKKKEDGKPLEDGGKRKPSGISPTQSPSQSQSQKVKWEENPLNPVAAASKAQGKKEEAQKIMPQPTPSIKKDGEAINYSLAKNYESAQNSYSLADKQHKSAKQGKTGWALNYISPIFEDIEEAISPTYKQEKQNAIDKAYTSLQTESANAKKAQLALKAEVPKILAPINSDLNSYLDKTSDGAIVPNIYKIDEFAKNAAKQAGLPEDGYFKKLIFNEAKANVAHKIIEPEVNNTFKQLYKKETGKELDEDLKSDYDKGFVKAQEIKQKTEQTAKQIATDISIDTKTKINQLQTSLTQQVDALNSEIIIGQEAINEKYKGLIQDNKFIGNQQQYQEYQQDIASLQEKQKQNAATYENLNKQFINEQHLISTKANARYRRQIEEISRLAQSNIEKESLKYSQAYKQDPKLKERIERLYKQAYGQTISKNEKIKETLSITNTPTVNFTKSFISALGGTMKGISTSLGFDAGQTFGDYLENKFQVGSTELKSLSDIIDPQKMAKSSGQLAGGMLPSMLGSAVAAYATGGESLIVQLTTTGLAGWAGETLDMAGRAEADKFESTGDAVAAKEASRKTVDSQVMLMPLYALEGLPFMEAPLKISKNKFIKAAVGGAIEYGTELPQEYLQNLSEEAIKNDESYKNMFKYHSAEKLKSTALNIAPVFLLGAGGQLTKQTEEEKAQYATQQAAKAFALKAKFADLAPSQREQFLFDVMQRQGVNFASTYLLASYTAGHIDKATFEEMGKTLTKSAEIITKAESLGLNPAQTKILNAFSVSYDKAKQAFDEETDPLLKSVAAGKLVDYEAQINSLATKKESNYAVVSYPNNEQYLFTHTELENALDNEDFANAISNGEINITLNGDKEKLNKKIEDTKTSIATAKEEQKNLLQEKEKNTIKEIESTFNVQIQDNVEGLGVEVQALGTEEETEQAKQALRDAGIKIRQDDKENIAGLPSQVGEGQELVTTEPQQGAGTETTSTGGVLQAQGIGTEGQRVEGVGEKVTQPTISQTGINITNKTELSGLEERTKTDKNKSAVLESAKKAIATLKSVFPDMDIFIHEDADAYNQTVAPIGGVENSRGNFAFGRDKDNNPTGTGRIDINLSNASETTVAHEVTHAILLKAFGDNPTIFKQFRDKISPILRADLNEELLKFEKMYEGLEVAPEEYLTQLSALLSKGAETVQYKPSTLRKIAAVINEFVTKITKGKFQPFKEEADFKNFVDFLNQISAAIREGDVIEKLNTQEAYSSGESIAVTNPKDFVAKKIGGTKSKAEIGDYEFPDNIEILKTADLPVKNLTDLVRQYNGRVVIITSDATGYGVDKNGEPIFGGFGFSANAKNVNDGIGFASVSIGTVKGTYTAAEKAYGEGKALVLVMIQPPHTTINNSYGSKYIIRGIKEIAGQSKEELAKTKEAIKDFIKNSTAIQNELKTNEASLKRGSEKRLIELIDSIDENTDLDAAVEEFIADTTFTIRKELGKGIILENKDIRTNKSTNYAKIALNNVGYNIFDFLKEYGDNTILNDDLILNNTGGYVVGGFELDILPVEQREELINDIQSKGIVHPLFNAKLPGANHFRLDGLYDVQENFSEYVRPETVITIEQKERDKLVRKYYKEDKFYKAEYRSIPLNKRTYTQLTIPAKTEFKEKYLRKKGGLVETIPNIATKVAKGEGFIPKPGAAEEMAQAEYKSKAQKEATDKALENIGEDAKETIKYNYQDSFGFNDFDWNTESQRENFREWLNDFEKEQFNKNLPKVIKEVKEDIDLLKEKELSDAKLRDFEDLIIPSLGNEALVPVLSKFEEDVLLDPNLTLEQMEEGFREAKNIIDEDGSLNMRKIEPGEILNKEKRISLSGFEKFVEKNPDYKGVFDAWKKIFDRDIELTLKETNAFRSPSIKELENLYKELTKSEAPTTIKSKSQKAKVDFGEGEEAKDNKKEFDKLTSTIPNSGELTKYLSGETIEKYEGEKPRNEQEVVAMQLRPALERGVDIIAKAKELFGENYVENLLQYVETENLPPANKALIYVSLENEMAKQKIENPSEAARIEKMQDLVRAKSQAFLRSNSLAINMGRLRKFAEVGYDANKLTDRFFSSRQMEDKKKIEDALQATADDINKEAARILTEDENIKAKIDEGVKEEIQKIYENLSTEKKKTVDKRLSVLDKLKQKIFNKYTFKSKPQLAEENVKSKSSVNNIIEEGYNKIVNAIKAGVEINKAINIGIDKIKENIENTTGQKWADEAEFKSDIIDAFKAEGLMESKKKEKSQEQILKEQQKKLEAEINRQLSIVLKLQEKLARYESGELIESDVREQLKDVPEIEELKQKVKEAQANYNKKIAEEKRIQDNIEKLEKELERVKARKQKTPKEKTNEVKQLSEEEEALVAKIKEENEVWNKEKENANKLEKQYKALETERNRQLERVSILKEKLEALKRGEKPKKNAKEIKLDTPEIEALKADIKKEEKRLAEAEAKKEKTIEERLEEAKARVKKQIESIQEQIANKQRVAKKDKLKPDAELENLIKQKDALNALLDKYVPKIDAYSEERNLKAAKARLENEILQLNKQIQKGQKDKFEKKESKENAELDALRAEKEARQAILEALDPTPRLFIENTLIEQGFGRQINVKTKDGVEKRWVLDWKKLAGEEGSVDNIRDRVEAALRDKGYFGLQLLRIQDSFVEEYNNLRQSIVEKTQNELAARNKEAVTPEQKSAVKKLVEMYNYGLFDKDPAAFETALAKTIGVSGISLQNFERVKELGEAMSNLFNTSFEGQPLNESELRTAIQVIEEKMRIILNSEAMQQGTTAFKLSEIAKGYMDASQRMLLNTIKQGMENPISGLLERFYSAIGYAGKIPEQLNAQQRKMARDIYKEMVLQKGMGYGNVGNAFISKGSLDAYVHNMSDSELVQGIMSIAMGKTILDAVDSAYKAKITQQKFTYNLIKILTTDRMVNGVLEKGMSKDEAKRYVAEKISGQSFEEAKKTAKDIIDKINTQAGKKIFNDSPEFVSRLATDIVNAALINGEKITKEMVTAAYNAAYKAAGRGLGHVSNNFISEQINTYSGKLESRINDAIKQKKYNKAAWLNLQAILYRNIINPFVGGGTNWVVLKAEKTGLGLLSGLASMYSNRDGKIDLTSETGMKELEDVMYNSMKTKDKFIRGAVGGAVTALAFMLIKATDADDEYEKWIKKNQWAKKYLSILTPEIMLAMLAAKSSSGYKTYLENSFNKNESFDKGKMAIKAMTALSQGEKDKAAGQAGQLLGSSIGTPIPWRLVRDGQQIWVGATGGEPYAINPAPAKSFMEGYLKGGLVDYLGFAPTSEDKTFIITKKDLDKPEYKIYKEKEIKIPTHRSINEYRVDTETGLMNEEQYNKFISLVDNYMENGFIETNGYKEKTIYGLKELPEQTFTIKQKGEPREEVLGKDLSTQDLQNKVNQLHDDAVEQAKFDLGLITKKPRRTVTINK